LYGASVWARRALNSRKRRFPARAVFILTSIVAPLVQLSYVRMVVMTLPYTVALTVAGLVGVLTMNYHE
jgi:Na+/H+ antiporter NhaB